MPGKPGARFVRKLQRNLLVRQLILWLGHEFVHHLFDDVLAQDNASPRGANRKLNELFELSGFPAPLVSGSTSESDRWRLSYSERLVYEDVRDLERVIDLDRLALLSDRLPQTVGSLLSLNSLREDLEVAFETVRSWLAILERTYACFRIAPFGPPKIRAVKKSQKLYLWDWARVEDESARLENMVAVHLMRCVDWLRDIEGKKVELRFFRSPAGHEVDFIMLKNKKPWIAIMVKSTDRDVDKNLKFLLSHANFAHAFQVSGEGSRDVEIPPINGAKVRLLPLARFLANLP